MPVAQVLTAWRHTSSILKLDVCDSILNLQHHHSILIWSDCLVSKLSNKIRCLWLKFYLTFDHSHLIRLACSAHVQPNQIISLFSNLNWHKTIGIINKQTPDSQTHKGSQLMFIPNYLRLRLPTHHLARELGRLADQSATINWQILVITSSLTACLGSLGFMTRNRSNWPRSRDK